MQGKIIGVWWSGISGECLIARHEISRRLICVLRGWKYYYIESTTDTTGGAACWSYIILGWSKIMSALASFMYISIAEKALWGCISFEYRLKRQLSNQHFLNWLGLVEVCSWRCSCSFDIFYVFWSGAIIHSMCSRWKLHIKDWNKWWDKMIQKRNVATGTNKRQKEILSAS